MTLDDLRRSTAMFLVMLFLPVGWAMHGANGGLRVEEGGAPGLSVGHTLGEPEIDRSPIWAMVYGRYLYLLGREMFWPDIASKDRFRIAVVNWPDLAADLGSRLDGRAIAGLPVDIIAIDGDDLSSEKGDFTLLFVGGSQDESVRDDLTQSLAKWLRKGDRSALVVTDGATMAGHDVALRRLKEGEGLSLCIAPDVEALAAKSLDLPPHFMQRPCP